MTADGLSAHDVAAELGIHKQTVGTYLRALTCASCGAWVTSRTGARVRCVTCGNKDRRAATWPTDQVLDALREWTRLYGELPSADGWRRLNDDPRWLDDWPQWPSSAVVVRRLGSWDQALRDAGIIDTGRPAMLRRLIAFVDEHGRAPRWSGEINRSTLGASSADYAREFGSWRGALRAAGLPVPPTWDRDSILAAAHDWAANNGGHAPSTHAWRAATEEHPHCRTVSRHFDSWEAMLAAAGLTPAPAWTRERLLAARDAWTERAPGWRSPSIARESR